MPNPRPSPVIRFNAKILTPVKRVNKYITKNEPKIADTPTRSGIPLATSPPNTNTNKIKVKGIEIASESFISSAIFLLISLAKTPVPLA